MAGAKVEVLTLTIEIGLRRVKTFAITILLDLKMIKQLERVFFPKGSDPPSIEERKEYLNPEREGSPYYGFIGNRLAVNKLIRIDFSALGYYNHLCHELSIAFIGTSGTGKTELAKRHSKSIGIPLLQLYPKAVKTVHNIFEGMVNVLAEYKTPLVEREKEHYYRPPPLNIFVDEVHTLSKPVMQALLTATEYKDCIMQTEEGILVDCSNVHWIVATTDRGKLFDAFDTRFTKIILNGYSAEEIAQIVSSHFPLWKKETCQLVAKYAGKIPREALAFAREMSLEREMNNKETWEIIAGKVAKDNEIDEYGMTKQRLRILSELGQNPIPISRLPIVAGCKIEELNKFILPTLLESKFVSVCPKGFVITRQGVEELKKRNISYREMGV